MIDREHAKVWPLCALSAPARGKMHERETVRPTGNRERYARIGRKRREQLLRLGRRERQRVHQQPAFLRQNFASSPICCGACGNLALSSLKVEQAASFCPSSASDMPSLSSVSGAFWPFLYFL